MTIPDGMNVPPHWAMYIGVSKFDDAVAQIERLGGSGLSPGTEVPSVGHFRTMKDPQGAMFAILEPASDASATPEAEPVDGEVAWHELYTTDAPAAMKFYGDLFDWKPFDVMDMGPMGNGPMEVPGGDWILNCVDPQGAAFSLHQQKR